MNKYFNVSRYKELLELAENNKSSSTTKDFFELLKYQADVQNEIHYNRRNDYFFLLN